MDPQHRLLLELTAEAFAIPAAPSGSGAASWHGAGALGSVGEWSNWKQRALALHPRSSH